MDSGQTQLPSNLAPAVPSEEEGSRGAPGAFDQIGTLCSKNTKESLVEDPVITRPVI